MTAKIPMLWGIFREHSEVWRMFSSHIRIFPDINLVWFGEDIMWRAAFWPVCIERSWGEHVFNPQNISWQNLFRRIFRSIKGRASLTCREDGNEVEDWPSIDDCSTHHRAGNHWLSDIIGSRWLSSRVAAAELSRCRVHDCSHKDRFDLLALHRNGTWRDYASSAS